MCFVCPRTCVSHVPGPYTKLRHIDLARAQRKRLKNKRHMGLFLQCIVGHPHQRVPHAVNAHQLQTVVLQPDQANLQITRVGSQVGLENVGEPPPIGVGASHAGQKRGVSHHRTKTGLHMAGQHVGRGQQRTL